GLNELEDFNMGSSNASEMKAEATGNPLIIEEVKILNYKDKNKRLKEKLQRCNCNIKIPSILEMAHKPIIIDIKGELLPHLTESYRKSKFKE
ncbi:hypothetical protein HMPREF1437_01106, partial [Helicobacter pylori HP116Bi]